MKKPGRKILLLVLPLGLAGAGAAAFLLMSGGSKPVEVPDPATGQHGPMLALEERVVNLQSGGPFRYAKIGLTVELRPPSADFYALAGEPRVAAEKLVTEEHEAAVPLILDALGTVVSARSSSELVSVEGRAHLKDQLAEAIRGVLGEEEVLNVYFTDLVMQ